MSEQVGRLLDAGRNCWRIETAERFAFIVDAADYFAAARAAMLKARRSILLIGWDFDGRIRFGEAGDEGPKELGDFLLWLARRTPTLEIRLLRWDTGALKAIFRGNTLWTILRWKAHPRITLTLDGAHPLASSHHQKIVAIDDSIAFCGGIDMTVLRWDRPSHLDDDPERVGPGGEPHGPWHDATSAFDGAAARALGELARDRWKAATGKALPPVEETGDRWPEELEPTFRGVRLEVARTLPKMPKVEPVHEIEELYIDLIGAARRWIYAESQYFASRRIARAIAERLIEEDGPEIVVVNPVTADGWLEPIVMDSARARLVEALRRVDRRGRFRIYHPKTEGGSDIYVHAKVLVADDRRLRVGSSNFNNRSLRLDTECDVAISADEPGNETFADRIAALRDGLVAEHLGVAPETVAVRLRETGSLIETIESLRGTGRTLAPYEAPDLGDFKEWLADNEILDPNGPDEIFEPLGNRGLFKGWRGRLRRGPEKR